MCNNVIHKILKNNIVPKLLFSSQRVHVMKLVGQEPHSQKQLRSFTSVITHKKWPQDQLKLVFKFSRFELRDIYINQIVFSRQISLHQCDAGSNTAP